MHPGPKVNEDLLAIETLGIHFDRFWIKRHTLYFKNAFWFVKCNATLPVAIIDDPRDF